MSIRDEILCAWPAELHPFIQENGCLYVKGPSSNIWMYFWGESGQMKGRHLCENPEHWSTTYNVSENIIGLIKDWEEVPLTTQEIVLQLL